MIGQRNFETAYWALWLPNPVQKLGTIVQLGLCAVKAASSECEVASLNWPNPYERIG